MIFNDTEPIFRCGVQNISPFQSLLVEVWDVQRIAHFEELDALADNR